MPNLVSLACIVAEISALKQTKIPYFAYHTAYLLIKLIVLIVLSVGIFMPNLLSLALVIPEIRAFKQTGIRIILPLRVTHLSQDTLTSLA